VASSCLEIVHNAWQVLTAATWLTPRQYYRRAYDTYQ